MKKIIILSSIFLVSTAVIAATYKVSPSGTVSGAKPVNVQNTYNNYYSQNYVNSRAVNSGNIDYIEIVMDFSGSMSAWIKEAKNSLARIVSQIPSSTNVGFRVFGQKITFTDTQSRKASVSNIQKSGSTYVVKTQSPENLSGACSATKQVAKIMPVDYNSIISGMNSVSIGGATPMVLALQKAIYNDFASIPQSSLKKIVLVTDGGENCGGDPCAFIRNLNRSDIQIDVVLVSSNSRALMCLSSQTGGNFYTLDNISDFSSTLTRSINSSNQQQVPQQNYEFIND